MKKIYDLELELKKIIETAVIIETNTTEGSPRTPEVIIGPVPSENPEELVPAIGIVASSGVNTLESKEINVEVSIVLVADETEEIYKKLYEMIDIIIGEILCRGIYLEEFEACTETRWEINYTGTFIVGSIIFKFIRTKTYRKDVDDWINGR